MKRQCLLHRVLSDSGIEDELSAVQVYGGGRYILWDRLDQAFQISDLLAGDMGAKPGWSS